MSEAGPLFKRENFQPQHQKCKYPSCYQLKVLVPQLTKLITNFGINGIKEMVSFELSLKKWGKMFFVCCDCVWNKEKIIWGLRIFLYPMLIVDEKHLYFFTELKTHHLSYSIYKHDAMDIADPSSLQDMCHMNFVIDLAHHSVSVVQWQSIRTQNPKVRGLIPHRDSKFFLCPTLVTGKNIFLQILTYM